ncbi:hypothetical protein Q3G72_000036 [Acer saccharum]|nr:hypothetical protein Q3G72_000036 [Acer saccharum]
MILRYLHKHYSLASTPAMFNNTLTEDDAFLCPVDGGIMITAGHLPFNINGLKIFTNVRGLGKPDIKDILECAADVHKNFTVEALMNSEKIASTSIKRVDYMTVYTSDLVKAVRKAAGDIFKVLEPLGAITFGSQFLEPDGLFPNHIPNPKDKATMKAITQAVLSNKRILQIHVAIVFRKHIVY